jgi:hypothetical protein
MRRTLQLCRLGLAGAAAVAVLTACGGSGTSNSSSSSSSSGGAGNTGAATTSSAAAAAGGSFCEQARSFATQVSSAVGSLGQSGQNSGQLLQQVVAQLQAITPPAAIASDWQTAVADIQQLAQALSTTNLSDPSAAAQLEQKVAPLEQSLETSGQHIDTYLQTKCGIDTGDTAATTS